LEWHNAQRGAPRAEKALPPLECAAMARACPYRAQLNVSGTHVLHENGWTIVCPQIEARGALDQLEEILAIEGVDMVCRPK